MRSRPAEQALDVRAPSGLDDGADDPRKIDRREEQPGYEQTWQEGEHLIGQAGDGSGERQDSERLERGDRPTSHTTQ